MEDLKTTLKQVQPKTRNPHLHSELHMLVDEVRRRFGETAQKGPGSFSFYLGFFKRLGTQKIRQILGEINESNVSDPKRLFWWKIKQESK
ncbi:hypothetical protein A3K24_01215 [candidate division Kazan bacterium RIFCSPHIGHO2_01_FULL_44_14]|uniref:Uncharacterized protein n=1 Tax=candidate division Kazan bacterium RIFCSPLOWO2_01_FULL_45_19 TaxID=1798538 RepID=A0A1F4NPT6_UNCK3|nr:hypothetical protein [uncultured bacterium]OGB73464.1 MAG: hypothetical protein A3K51_01215 [candidate division Kazan bacterium RIFCSPLOWO2_01_FULL_45_19]OGB77709.1 MAG: hypothetical protein A3K24_01215 [candidate division Kazan bacterium RIFCSPHIGHO2_01_FULL_44_14]